ncbi:hypothetical protein [Microbacterium sp. NIBRBAC000506063]|uniref:hypothetical protein n=1 Tax=Microbacterium sp. NIBRBAC000506063 TaxID=2734618 RepID=UPI001BB6718B|nr:hypothetical protein [Microbacterium sp. NIBRBAC000506063]QTV79182.1 hypothetical protein KAE78_08910 [Microbacterium sp. NIBRBAC000506063]
MWGAPATDAGSRPLHVPAESAIVFVDNHDTERGEARVTYRQPDLYAIANALLLADDYGTPVVYSGYAFTDRDAGAPTDADGRVSQASCADAADRGQPDATTVFVEGERTCVQSWPVITGMLDFRVAVGDAPRLAGVEEGDAYGFERERRGILAVNVGRAAETLVIPTSMPDGAYCDVIAGGAGRTPASARRSPSRTVRRPSTSRAARRSRSISTRWPPPPPVVERGRAKPDRVET